MVALIQQIVVNMPRRLIGAGCLRLLNSSSSSGTSSMHAHKSNSRYLSQIYTHNHNNSNNNNHMNHITISQSCCPTSFVRLQQQQQLLTWRNSRNYACLSTKSSSTHCGNATKTDTKAASSTAATDLFGESANMGLFAKFKHMYKQYWYVLIPVHVVTSIGWFGGFYYLSKSGVDVPSLLQYMHLSETIIEKVQGSDMGHYAIAYLCYKVATPVRYAITLGGTTVSIKYLVQAGHIKPMPTKREMLKMYEDKKARRASAKADKAEKDEFPHSQHK